MDDKNAIARSPAGPSLDFKYPRRTSLNGGLAAKQRLGPQEKADQEGTAAGHRWRRWLFRRQQLEGARGEPEVPMVWEPPPGTCWPSTPLSWPPMQQAGCAVTRCNDLI